MHVTLNLLVVMTKIEITKNRSLICFVLLIGCQFFSNAQEFNTFDVRYQNNIKGDLTFIANNIVNRDDGTSMGGPDDPYDLTGDASNYNDWFDMQYIDIDNDPTTFSSSTANFTFPEASCNLIRYAGLYWSATYPSARAGDALGTDRQSDFNQVKLKIPGGSYVDVTAAEVLFDGFTSTDSSVQQNSPYACYADVTSVITPLVDPTGDYTVANVRSVVGSLSPGGGAAGGWTLIIVYENPTLSGKLITTFDGFARVRNEDPVDIDYTGFNTIPSGPVRANIGAAALEGDNRITGDQMFIREDTADPFVEISNAANPGNNFFNSNITLNGVITSNRTPNSINTLGYDTDIFLLNNPSNSVIGNSATQATFRFTSTGDQYYPFFNSFNVEIIEPNIVLEKKVEDIAGNDITGQGVNLGQSLDYVLSFQNLGNDDASNYTVRDVLPVNVTLNESNMILPTGVTYTYDLVTRTVVFTIPNDLVEIGDPTYSIRMRVKVAENCYAFVDACSDNIQNLAYSTYQGVLNNNQITDDPSVSDFDNCGFGTPGATNFLLDDLSDCNFTRTVQLCGTSVLLDAGDNFDSYLWVRDDNGNGLIDDTDTVLDDGDPDNDPSTLLVNDIGTYIVDKIVADPCKGFTETITVEYSGGIVTSPIIDYYNTVNGDGDPSNDILGEIASCSDDGGLLPIIYLCGSNATELLQVNIVDAQSLVWEKLDEFSCPPAGEDCANKNPTCSWSQVGSGTDYTVSGAGKYRVVVGYQNGCFNRFYFDTFQNTLDIQYNKNDIVCTTPGNITITNLGSGYGYRLVNVATGTILVPFSANNGPSFDITTNGAYRVGVVQLDSSGTPISGSCVFETPDIGILKRDFQVVVTTTAKTCNGLGGINLQVSNVDPNYEYEIRLDDGSNGGQGTLLDNETAQPDNNFTFSNLDPGNYIAIVRTEDGCSYSEKVTIADENNLELTARISQHISCKEGNILMESKGGSTPHTYAIWSYVDENGTVVISYPTVNDIPASAYQTSQIFDIYDAGDYTFVVVDKNNCFDISNTVNIILVPAVEYTTAVADERCFGAADGSITYNMTNTNGYQVAYTLVYPDTTTVTNSSGTFTGLPQGDYTVILTQSKGGASCDYPEDFTISGPVDGIVGTVALVQEYTCLQNGIIEARDVTGGSAPYEYSIDGINFVSGPGAETFSGLIDGTYSITIRDARGCTFVTDTLTLDPPNVPSDLIFTSTEPVCPTLTSDVTATVTDGNAPFTFEIIAPSGISPSSSAGETARFNDLSPDTYTFRVTDGQGCTYEETYTISPVVPINALGTLVRNVSCIGASDGGVDFTVNGFDTTYSYTINGGASVTARSAATINLTGLIADDYTLIATDDSTNCTATATVTVSEPATPLAFTYDLSPLTCAADASVTVNATGGRGGYSYELVRPDTVILGPQSSTVFGGLDQVGTYTISVTDAGGCTVTDTFVVTAPINPTARIDAASDLCYDPSTLATIAIGVFGGQAPFYYSMNGGSAQTSNTFDGLTPATYVFTVLDSNGCTDDVSITVRSELAAGAVLTKDIDCTASPDAQIDVTIDGGNADFSYQVNIDDAGYGPSTSLGAGITTFAYTTGNPGDYRFRITDSQGCTTETNITITTPAETPVITSVTPTHITCYGEDSGTLDVVIDTSVGVAAYTITIFETISGTDYGTRTSGLPAGNYQITVTDDKSCSITTNQILTEPSALDPNIVKTDLMCTASGSQLGTISVDASGGTPDYRYQIYNTDLSYTASYDTSTGTNDHIFTGLDFGDYTVRVADSNGCESVSTVTITTGPDVLISTQGSAGCSPGSGGMLVEAQASNGTLGAGPFYFALYPAPAFDTADPAWFPEDSAPAPDNSYTFTGLTPGVTYTFIVHDTSTNCEYVEEASVPVSTNSTLNATLDAITDISCFGSIDGSVDFTFNGYGGSQVDYELFTFTTNSTTGLSGSATGLSGGDPYSGSLTGLSPGEYYILFTEVDGPNAGCVYASPEFTVRQSPALLEITTTSTNAFCNSNSGTITAQARYGTGPYLFQLELASVTAPTASTWKGSNTSGFFNADNADYVVYVMDANNCIRSVPISVGFDPSPVISLVVTNQCATTEGDFIIQTTLDSIGVAPYFLSLDGGAFQSAALGAAGSTYDFTDLSSGTHTVEIRDSNGCGNLETVEIYTPTTISVETAFQPTCAGGDGSIEVAAYGGSGDYLYELFDSMGTSMAGPQPAPAFSGLDPDTYRIFVYDRLATGCNASIEIIMELPKAVIFTTESTNVTCNGDSDGTITLVLDATMTNPPYTYTLFDGTDPAITQDSPIFSGLAAGTYDITVTSDRNCTDTQTVVIGEPNMLIAAETHTEFACAPDNTVSQSVITVNGIGGTAPYTYSIDGTNFFGSNTFDITDNGSVRNITVTVRDDNGCTDTIAVTIDPLNVFTVTIAQDTAISCAGPEAVTLTVADNGDAGNTYTYEVLPIGNPNAVQTGTPTYNKATFDLATVGSYTFRITDTTTGCYVHIPNYGIAPYDFIKVSALATAPVTCFGDNNGSLEIEVAGYSGPYTYTVHTAAGAATAISGSGNTTVNPLVINSLAGGNYFVRLTESNYPSCSEDSNTVQIVSPDKALAVIVDPIANVTCSDDQGEILVDPSGGYSPYDIVLTNTTISQAYSATDVTITTFSGLSAGNYTVRITDANNCVIDDTEILVRPDPITADIGPLSTTLVCYGDSDATLNAINVSGGQGTYQYQLNVYDPTGTIIDHTSGGQISPTFNNLGAGIYSITVSDGWGCDMETEKATIMEPTGVYATLVRTGPLTCRNDAKLLLMAFGGTPGYEYSVDGTDYLPMGGGNTHTFTVPAGTYRYYVRDAFGCTSVRSNEINEDAIMPLRITIDASAAVINCNGDNTAIIDAAAEGGLGNYRYELFADTASTNSIAGPQVTGQFSDLAIGSYYVRATSVDCEVVSEVIRIVEPAPMEVVGTSVNVTCNGENDGRITVELSGGSGGYRYAISPNLNRFDTVNTFTGLRRGDYSVIAQDSNGCFEHLGFTIEEPSAIGAVATTTPEICAGNENGSISLEISEGTAPYSTSINSNADNDFITGRTSFTDLAAGTYIIFVKDSLGCQMNLTAVIDPGANLNATITPIYVCTEDSPDNYIELVLEDPSVESEVMYALDSSEPDEMVLEANFRDIAPGGHYITIAHSNGCTSRFDFEIEGFEPLILALEQNNMNEITAIATGGRPEYTFYFDDRDKGPENTYYIRRTGTYTVTVVDENGCEAVARIYMEFIDIEIPNFFTPDGNNSNDFWKPVNIDQFTEIDIKVFDRYGRVVCRMGLAHRGWDGRYDDAPLPTGDYWYIVKPNGENDEREFVGHFTLFR